MLKISRLFAHVNCNRSKPFVVHLAIFLIFAGVTGCAKNHYYIEPNGQVTTVGHQPFWGPTRVNPDPVHLTEVPTTIAGATVVRQRVIDIEETTYADGSKCAALMFDHELIAVAARVTKPFQGWRYLDAAAAPIDLAEVPPTQGSDQLPPALRRELEHLGLI